MVQNNVSKTPSNQYGFSNLAEVANNDPLYMRSISMNNLPAPPAPKPLPPLMAYPTPPPMRKYPLPPKPVIQIQPGPNDIPPETAGIFDYMIWSKVNLVIGAIVVGIPGLILSIITRRYKRKGDVKISKIMSKITLAINSFVNFIYMCGLVALITYLQNRN